MSAATARLARLERRWVAGVDPVAEALVTIESGTPAIVDYATAYGVMDWRRYVLASAGTIAASDRLVQLEQANVHPMRHLLRLIAFPPDVDLPRPVSEAVADAVRMATGPRWSPLGDDMRVGLGRMLAALGPNGGRQARLHAWAREFGRWVLSPLACRLARELAFPLVEMEAVSGLRLSRLIDSAATDRWARDRLLQSKISFAAAHAVILDADPHELRPADGFNLHSEFARIGHSGS